MSHQNTASPSTAEPGCGPTPQANETGGGPVDMQIWTSLDCNRPTLTIPVHHFHQGQDQEETARVLLEILVGIATPWEILSDNGQEFMGKELREVLSKRQIKHVTTTAYSPQSNGILAWFHRYLGQCIRMSLKYQVATDKDGWHWKGACLSALEAYQKLPHTSTQCPLFLAMGQDPMYTTI